MRVAEGGQVGGVLGVEGLAQLEAQVGEGIGRKGGPHHRLHAGGAGWQVGIVRMRLGSDLLLLAPLGAPILEPDLEKGWWEPWVMRRWQATVSQYPVWSVPSPAPVSGIHSRAIIQLMGVVIENAPLISF